MSSDDAAAAAPPRPTVFLSYATQDRPAARALQEALSALGLEVWLDESELGGGEAWDQKIRRQIRECQYFMPIVSAQTEARIEGYFRREWRLAVERSLDIADGHLFLLPVVIDDTDQAKARVPEKFLAVQWLKVPQGRSTPALEALCRRIATGQAEEEPPRRRAAAAMRRSGARVVPDYPPFPAQAPGGKLPRAAAITAWTARTCWIAFLRLPRWVRIVAYAWLGIALLSRVGGGDSSDVPDVTTEDAAKIKSIAQQYQGSTNKADIAKLGAQIARELAGDGAAATGLKTPLLAVPFVSAPGDAAAARLADSTFAMIYGRLSLSRHGHVALSEQALAATNLDNALERGSTQKARYVLFGAVENPGSDAVLDIKIAAVQGRSLLWTKSFPVAGADAEKIAAEVDAKVPSLDD